MNGKGRDERVCGVALGPFVFCVFFVRAAGGSPIFVPTPLSPMNRPDAIARESTRRTLHELDNGQGLSLLFLLRDHFMLAFGAGDSRGQKPPGSTGVPHVHVNTCLQVAGLACGCP